MKKFMITAAIACAVVIAQAASVQWTCTNVYNGKGDESTKVSGIAYLMLESSVADFTKLSGQGAKAVNAALADALVGYTSTTAGAFGLTKENADLGLKDASPYGNSYLVIFDSTTVSDTSKFYVTASKELYTLEGDNVSKMQFASQSAASKLAANWHSVAGQPGPEPMPEPTSGLMLLLGMAGLALRRRRA